MFNNYYLVSIKGKDLKRFLKHLYRNNIRFINISRLEDELFCKLDEKNYKKILNIKTSYKIELNNVYGYVYIKKIIKNNIIFIISFILGLFYLFFLGNVIFDIDIIHDDKNIKKVIFNDLEKLNIKRYSFIKDYDYIMNVKNKIIEKNKDIIEWLEIERVGTKYVIKLEKRIKNIEEDKTNKRHLIAKKAGIIKKIEAHDGEIVKKVNDYVKKGDIIISGEIHKGDDIKNSISANGSVYGEVWYKVKVTLPINYYIEEKTGNKINTFKIRYLDKDYNILNKNYLYKDSKTNILFSDFYDMFSLSYGTDLELKVIDSINTIDYDSVFVDLAREKIINKLDINEYIISQKKLKTIINDSTINVEVFFKVYENISDYLYF